MRYYIQCKFDYEYNEDDNEDYYECKYGHVFTIKEFEDSDRGTLPWLIIDSDTKPVILAVIYNTVATFGESDGEFTYVWLKDGSSVETAKRLIRKHNSLYQSIRLLSYDDDEAHKIMLNESLKTLSEFRKLAVEIEEIFPLWIGQAETLVDIVEIK